MQSSEEMYQRSTKEKYVYVFSPQSHCFVETHFFQITNADASLKTNFIELECVSSVQIDIGLIWDLLLLE